jgi:hypothetical protein
MSEQIWPPKQRVAKKAPRTCRKRGASPLSNRKSQSTVRLSKRSRRLVRPPRHMIVVNRVFSPRQYNFVIGPIPVSYTQAADCRLRGCLADRGRRDGLSCLKHGTKPAGKFMTRRLDRPCGRISMPIERSLPSKVVGRPVMATGKATVRCSIAPAERMFGSLASEYFYKDDHTLRTRLQIVSRQRPPCLAHAVYEGMHHRVERSVLQCDDRDLEGPGGKINRQYFD